MSSRLHLFVHVPKTGGTSFKISCIDPNVDIGRAYLYRGLPGFALSSMSSFDFVDGHYPYGLHLFTRKQCLYSTLLREPIDQAISFYYFVRQCDYPGYKHPLLRPASRLSLVDFTRRYSNMQTFQLAGFPWNRFLTRRSPQLLDIARNHLFKRFSIYGFLDEIEDFERRFAALHNMRFNPVHEQSKITRSRPRVSDLPDADFRELGRIQSLDIILYQEARRQSGHSGL